MEIGIEGTMNTASCYGLTSYACMMRSYRGKRAQYGKNRIYRCGKEKARGDLHLFGRISQLSSSTRRGIAMMAASQEAETDWTGEVGVLLLRLSVSALMLHNGLDKLQDPEGKVSVCLPYFLYTFVRTLSCFLE